MAKLASYAVPGGPRRRALEKRLKAEPAKNGQSDFPGLMDLHVPLHKCKTIDPNTRAIVGARCFGGFVQERYIRHEV